MIFAPALYGIAGPVGMVKTTRHHPHLDHFQNDEFT
jgi:hypothetical protein